jgi:hypothetical protein
MGGLIIGIILILAGISALTGVSLGGFIVAIILIAIGIRILSRGSARGSWHWEHCHHIPSGEMSVDEVAIFSPLNKAVATDNFKGGRIVMVFSGGEIDLSKVKTDRTEIELEVVSVFSGVEVIVPKDWKIKTNANVFLGNMDAHTVQGGEGGVTLTIHGSAVFGDIEVRK